MLDEYIQKPYKVQILPQATCRPKSEVPVCLGESVN